MRYYFSKNYDYQTILLFLEREHGVNISKRSLLNRLKEYGLRGRERDVDEDIIKEYLNREVDCSGSLLGYRAMWRKLHSKHGINVPRSTVQCQGPFHIDTSFFLQNSAAHQKGQKLNKYK